MLAGEGEEGAGTVLRALREYRNAVQCGRAIQGHFGNELDFYHAQALVGNAVSDGFLLSCNH